MKPVPGDAALSFGLYMHIFGNCALYVDADGVMLKTTVMDGWWDYWRNLAIHEPHICVLLSGDELVGGTASPLVRGSRPRGGDEESAKKMQGRS